ncbi:hypothetical protein OH687_26625 [Burkholderia anthina]|nr:hypothetical protein OH687_26625 [Burkholderia anthina]
MTFGIDGPSVVQDGGHASFAIEAGARRLPSTGARDGLLRGANTALGIRHTRRLAARRSTW